MAEPIEAFYRVPSQPNNARTGLAALTWRLMRVHFALMGVVLLGATLALGAYLYSLEFSRVELSASLRLTRSGDLYTPKTQQQVAGLLALALAALVQFRAAQRLSVRRRGGLWPVRLSALMVLVGLPMGVGLWVLSGAGVAGGGLVRQTLQEMALPVRVAAGFLVFQALLGAWYEVALFWSAVRRFFWAEGAFEDVLLARARTAALVLWALVVMALGVALGVLTDWLYELPVPRPEPGELLYASTFDAFNDEWDIFPGRDSAQVVALDDLGADVREQAGAWLDGAVLQVKYGSGASEEVVWSVLDRKFRDFDLRVTAQLAEGPEDQNQFGVIFRYRDPDDFYIFRITADGYYSLVKVRDGVQEKISDWGVSEAIHQGNAPNVIRVVGQGDRFRFYVNGEPLPLCLRGENETSMWATWEGPGVCYTDDPRPIFQDGTFAQGKIALAAGTIDGSAVSVLFDDIVIVGPAPDALDVAETSTPTLSPEG